jgi:hypothetical protein
MSIQNYRTRTRDPTRKALAATDRDDGLDYRSSALRPGRTGTTTVKQIDVFAGKIADLPPSTKESLPSSAKHA